MVLRKGVFPNRIKGGGARGWEGRPKTGGGKNWRINLVGKETPDQGGENPQNRVAIDKAQVTLFVTRKIRASEQGGAICLSGQRRTTGLALKNRKKIHHGSLKESRGGPGRADHQTRNSPRKLARLARVSQIDGEDGHTV